MGIFAEQQVVVIAMAVSYGMSLLLKIGLSLLYGKMIKEADNMSITNNKQLKQCKIKFSHCYEMNNGMANVPIFVDKFISRLSLGPLSYQAMYHLSGQLMLLSVVFSGVGVCRSIASGKTLGAILPFYIVSFIGLYLFFSISTISDIKTKRRILKINLIDYLENHLSPRMKVTNKNIELLYGSDTERKSGKKKTITEDLPKSVNSIGPEEIAETTKEDISEEELEALLKEFLIS